MSRHDIDATLTMSLEDTTVKLNRFSMLAGALVAGSLALTACGGSSAPTPRHARLVGLVLGGAASLSGTLNGAGSTAQQAAMQAWATKFQETNPDVTVNYDPVGSGGGREQFLAGGATSFAGSDAALTDEELAKAKTRVRRHRRDGPAGLRQPHRHRLQPARRRQPPARSRTPLAKIFAGKITKWDDAAIKADNPDAKLPSTAITTVHRSDDSGTTQNFTDYLSKAAPSSWTYPPAQTWPVKGGEAAEGTSGVIAAIKAGDGSIGYADAQPGRRPRHGQAQGRRRLRRARRPRQQPRSPSCPRRHAGRPAATCRSTSRATPPRPAPTRSS